MMIPDLGDPIFQNLFNVSFYHVHKQENHDNLKECVNSVIFDKEANIVYINFNLNINLALAKPLHIEKDLFELFDFNIEIQQHTRAGQVFKVITLKECSIENDNSFLYNLDYTSNEIQNITLNIKYKDWDIVYTDS